MSEGTPIRAALYLRVSTNRQAEHDLSIPDQRGQAERYCEANHRCADRPCQEFGYKQVCSHARLDLDHGCRHCVGLRKSASRRGRVQTKHVHA